MLKEPIVKEAQTREEDLGYLVKMVVEEEDR